MVLRFTNANGEQFDFRSPDIAVERVDGTGASEVDTFLIERAFREGASYVRRRSRPRIITIPFSFLGRTQPLWDVKREISAKLSPALGLGTLEYEPAGADQVYAIDASVRRLDTNQRPAYGVGTVQFECPFPFWRGATLQSHVVNVTSSSTTHNIAVGGELPVYPLVTVGENHAGSFTNPRWQNNTTGKTMTTSGLTVSSGQRVVADHDNATLDRAPSALNLLSALTETSEFWELRTGTNSVQCFRSGTLSTLDYRFEWWELFSGV